MKNRVEILKNKRILDFRNSNIRYSYQKLELIFFIYDRKYPTINHYSRSQPQ
jgi:hypothetical protein